MSLHSFLNFNKKCPICSVVPLTLYWRWRNSTLFKGVETEAGTYVFSKYLSSVHNWDHEDSRTMTLMDYGSRYETIFSCPTLLNEVKTRQTYFYFMCNERGFDARNNNEINMARGCYYRSSPFMEFQKMEDNWELRHCVDEFAGLAYKDEAFCLKKRIDGEDKVYMLNRDLEIGVSKLWYYSITDEQRKDDKFFPRVFRKELPPIERPSFNDMEKLINKFETWILMS